MIFFPINKYICVVYIFPGFYKTKEKTVVTIVIMYLYDDDGTPLARLHLKLNMFICFQAIYIYMRRGCYFISIGKIL